MLRFTIRELALVTMLVGTGLGWYADRRALWNRSAVAESHENTLRHYLEERGTSVRYVDTWQEHSVTIAPLDEAPMVAHDFHREGMNGD